MPPQFFSALISTMQPKALTIFPDDSLRDQNIAIFDTENPCSIVSVVPPDFAKNILKIDREFFHLSENELHSQAKPSPQVARLRLAFWGEYHKATLEPGTKINLTRVYSVVCSKDYFYSIFNPPGAKAAWILTPPATYATLTEETLYFGLEKIRNEILTARIQDPKTKKLDAKAADIVLKAVNMLDQRVKGSVLQRSQNLTLHAHTNTPPKEPTKPVDIVEINKRIAELEEAEQKQLPSPEEPT